MKYELWQDKNFSDDLLKLIDTDKPVMFDTETIGLYGKIRLAQFYQAHFKSVIIIEYPQLLQLMVVLDKVTSVIHNASYDISTIQLNLNHSNWVPSHFEDTFYLSRLFYYNEEKFSLDKCIEYAIGFNPYDELYLEKKDLQKSSWDVPVLDDEQLKYAAMDVFYMQQLYDKVKHINDDYSYKLDIINLRSCLNFQSNGFSVDTQKVNDMYSKNSDRLKEIDLPINANSYVQVRPYIDSTQSDKLGLIRLISQGNTRARDVKEVRSLLKINNFLTKFTTNDGLIHGVFSPSARSGRGTCRNQNLQQLPRITKEVFGVKENGDSVLIYSDFSQLELRCVCAVTGESNMEKLYREDIDIHTYSAKLLFNTEEPTKKQRHIAKSSNFGLLYGAGIQTYMNYLLQSTGVSITEEEAKNTKSRWLNLWPGIVAWQKQGIRDWRSGKSWQTPLGRKYKAKLMTDQLNIQIQGFGAEVAKLANHYMDQRMEEEQLEGWKGWQRNFIHDSYIFEVPNDEKIYSKVCKIIADSMQESWSEMSKNCKIVDLPMPVKVDVGYNWGDIENENRTIHTLVQ